MSREFYCDGHVEVRHCPAKTGDPRHVVTFDHFQDEQTFERPAFSEHFFASRNIAATHVLTRTNAWFQYPDFDVVLAAVREKTRSATRILAYGSSMGGYGAVRFADAVGASQVIALSPQYSIDRQVMPNERRWPSHSRRTRFIAARNGAIACSADVLICYDPRGPDRDHALRIAQDIPVRMLAVPYGGHPVGSFLAEAGLLAQMVLDMLDGGVDLPGLEQACRLARRHSANYMSALAEAQPARRAALALRIATQAVILQPHHPPAWHFLALRLHALGDMDGALAVYRNCIALERTPAYLFRYATMLLEAGNADEALGVARDLLGDFGVSPHYHYLAFRALLAMNEPRLSAGHLYVALVADRSNPVYWRAIGRIVRKIVKNMIA